MQHATAERERRASSSVNDAPAHIAPAGPVNTGGTAGDAEPRLINVLVTPKLSFALRLQPGWKRASDIEEDALRLAFLARFPVKLRAEHLTFRCATPAASLETGTLVYRIGAADVSEDRVLLSVLSELDKSYTAKFEAALERARADCLSASNCFQVVADEERDQLRDQLLRATTSSKRAVSELRTNLGGLAEENASLRRAATQTDGAQDEAAAREEMAHWQQQLSAVSEWLKTGAALLQDAPGVSASTSVPSG
ncbi:hypothetical protein EMIHUDRAFT_214063 [Emiliania huxleyi CCMP1516]|uniref:Uncharacterized protein n=2 Tax=Emiliania huxleyi TaxID=2903 RepID=A0A0D3IKI9_EMIH1|nr:hypothetical protein EMIHUDRAFT_214063 [Emiliania huxleyi CCMP1516]EOD11774.1 hypothetical protein EMIHUDRAFT_214063 [Emiliania huxleyi CCMP1516]|eukprot:XP_005764203.1 hypothetical protein EMIHUDRAFT_214063 [Emiliania huxleyi CCMP1516]